MLEREIKAYLTVRKEPFSDFSSSHTALDFYLANSRVHIDAKEKRQRFNMENWQEVRMPQEQVFIIDDLAVRKLLLHAPNSFSLIKDSSVSPALYYVYSIVDFLCIPKIRCKRQIQRTTTAFKGKWIIDFRDAASFESLPDAMSYIIRYGKKHSDIFKNYIDCWGRYPSERIPKSGTTRTRRYWSIDAKVRS